MRDADGFEENEILTSFVKRTYCVYHLDGTVKSPTYAVFIDPGTRVYYSSQPFSIEGETQPVYFALITYHNISTGTWYKDSGYITQDSLSDDLATILYGSSTFEEFTSSPEAELFLEHMNMFTRFDLDEKGQKKNVLADYGNGYTEKTINIIKQFQINNGFSGKDVDGRVGPKTKQVLVKFLIENIDPFRDYWKDR